MAIQGPFPLDFGLVFPHGAGLVGGVSAVADFNAAADGQGNRPQSRDKTSGLPVWQVDLVDFDPNAREKTHKVKVAAAVQPVPPEAIPGTTVRPVVLEGLTITPYIKDGPRPRIAYSLRATALAAPGRASADTGKAA